MMRNTLFVFFVLITINSYSQSSEDFSYGQYFGDGTFVIKGKVENKPADMDSWKFAVTGFTSNVPYTMPVADDGSFEKEIPITDVQDVYLYLDDAITIFSYPGDTIEVYFDGNKHSETLRLKGKNTDREKELALCLQIYNNHRQAFLDIPGLKYNRDIGEEELISKLNEYYDSKIETIKSFEKENGKFPFLGKFRDEAYFESILPLTNKKELLPKIHCEYPDEISTLRDNGTESAPTPPYTTLDYKRFRTNDSYRTFLEYYVSDSGLFFKPVSAYVKNNYYFALSCLTNDAIRDWYITRKLNFAFTYFNFNETAFVYNEFKKICANKDYLNLLERKYQAALRIQPGSPAPDFELKDENGKLVKLSDLKGKFVYMDFWGMSCAPCIHEFRNSTPQLREKYKDFDIVYVYINITDDEASWKRGIERYDLQGINLIAEGWEENPTCQAYNILGIPHYVLIDKDGKIVNNKSERPSVILSEEENSEFDQVVRGRK